MKVYVVVLTDQVSGDVMATLNTLSYNIDPKGISGVVGRHSAVCLLHHEPSGSKMFGFTPPEPAFQNSRPCLKFIISWAFSLQKRQFPEHAGQMLPHAHQEGKRCTPNTTKILLPGVVCSGLQNFYKTS